MKDRVQCVVWRHRSRWHGACLDLDIRVTGATFAATKASLGDAVNDRLDKIWLKPPTERIRLLDQRARWRIRLAVAWRGIRASRGGSWAFTIPVRS